MATVARFGSLCIVSTMTLLSMPSALQSGQHVEAAQPRHGEVRDDHVGAKPLGRFDQQLAVAHRADDVEVVISEQSGEAFRDDRVVVGEQDGGSPHRLTRD